MNSRDLCITDMAIQLQFPPNLTDNHGRLIEIIIIPEVMIPERKRSSLELVFNVRLNRWKLTRERRITPLSLENLCKNSLASNGAFIRNIQEFENCVVAVRKLITNIRSITFYDMDLGPVPESDLKGLIQATRQLLAFVRVKNITRIFNLVKEVQEIASICPFHKRSPYNVTKRIWSRLDPDNGAECKCKSLPLSLYLKDCIFTEQESLYFFSGLSVFSQLIFDCSSPDILSSVIDKLEIDRMEELIDFKNSFSIWQNLDRISFLTTPLSRGQIRRLGVYSRHLSSLVETKVSCDSFTLEKSRHGFLTTLPDFGAPPFFIDKQFQRSLERWRDVIQSEDGRVWSGMETISTMSRWPT